MNTLSVRSGAVFVAATFLAAGVSAQADFQLNPRGTYLRTNQDSTVNPLVIELASLKVVPGDVISLTISGTFQYTGSPGSQGNGTIAVFSSTSTILATDQPHRVPGAVDAGRPVFTAPTFHGGLPTDIPEDFAVASGDLHGVNIRIPVGAAFLVVCAADTLYSDNADPDGDYHVSIAPGCIADFNLDGVVNSTDVSDYINAWFQDQANGTLITDWDGNGVVNSTDVSAFINDWFEDQAAGCG